MTIVNFEVQLQDYMGRNIEISIPDVSEGKAGAFKQVPATLKLVSMEALMGQYPNDTPSAEEKLRRYSLAKKIHSSPEVHLAAEDISKIKELINKAWGTMIVGIAFELIDPQG